MKIRGLELRNFGKIKALDLTFSPGLNIIIGSNGSGKTSILDGIYAMLYGFIKPDAKRAITDEKFNRYLQFNHSTSGTLDLSYEGKDYRIVRLFKQGGDETQVYDISNTNDLTKEMELLSPTKVIQPGIFFTDLSAGDFNRKAIKAEWEPSRHNLNKFDEMFIDSYYLKLQKLEQHLLYSKKMIGNKKAPRSKLGHKEREYQELVKKYSTIRDLGDHKKLEEDIAKLLQEQEIIEKKIDVFLSRERKLKKNGRRLIVPVVLSLITLSIIFVYTKLISLQVVIISLLAIILISRIYVTLNADEFQEGEELYDLYDKDKAVALALQKAEARALESEDVIRDKEVLLRELKQIEKEIKELELNKELIDQSLSLAQKIKENWQSTRMPALEDTLAKYAYRLTGDDDLLTSINEAGEIIYHHIHGGLYREDLLSAGEREQMSLAYHLTTGEFSANSFPFLLDEPFAYSDRNHRESILKNLLEVSLERQVILTSCMLDRDELDHILVGEEVLIIDLDD